jgi:hypothetical protein
MMLTIELPPEMQAQLQEKAERSAQPVENYVLSLVRRDLMAPKAKRKLVGYGAAAHLGVSSEDVHRARREEVALEEEREAYYQQAARQERAA